MSLAEYRRKRRFDRTQEPAPEDRVRAKSGKRAIFVVQLHHASRRHYDFRLEVGGTLKSWAVPSGPSFDPKVKRLAVEVEDHPIAYAKFHGTIPKGQYGGGHVAIFDEGAWAPVGGDAQAQLAKGHLRFELFGKKLKGSWHLVRTRRGSRQPEWLLFKSDDEYAGAVEADDLLDDVENPPASAQGSARGATRRPAATKVAGATAASNRGQSTARASNRGQSTARARAKSRTSAAHKSSDPAPRKVIPGDGRGQSTARSRNSASRKKKAVGSDPGSPRDWAHDATAISGAKRAKLRAAAPAPQLTRLVADAPTGDEWLHEVKWDGYRILATLVDGTARLWSRNANEWTGRLSEIADALEALGVGEAAFDGELVTMDGARSDFGLLQSTLSGEKDAPLVYVLFDVMHLAGYDLTSAPLVERKALLEKLLAKPPAHLAYSTHVVGNGAQAFALAREQQLEGIISKRADSPYSAGRSDAWRKVKTVASEEFAVVGFTPPKGSRTGLGSLLLAAPDAAHGWRYVGRVGSGFTDEQLSALAAVLKEKPQRAPTAHVVTMDTELRRATWIAPEQVVEVNFRGIGNQGLLRQPSLKTLRVDKSPDDLRKDDTFPPVRPAAATAQLTRRATKAAPRKRAASKKTAPRKTNEAAPARSAPSDEFRLTSPERVVYPDRGTRKIEVAEYYVAVMNWLLPEIAHRPLSIVRCTEGIDKACFFQKHLTQGLTRVGTVRLKEESGKNANYLVAEDAAGVMELVQFNALEFHPWGAKADDPERADRLVFDLDPGPGVGWDDVVAATRDVKALLEELGLVTFLRTSGGKGLHVVVPLRPAVDWDVAKPFARAIAETLARRSPDRYLATATKSKRQGRIFIDYLRNGRGATSVASYSLRARPGAPVAVPLAWRELGRLKSAAAFDIDSVPKRLARLKADPWEGIDNVTQNLAHLAKKLGI